MHVRDREAQVEIHWYPAPNNYFEVWLIEGGRRARLTSFRGGARRFRKAETLLRLLEQCDVREASLILR